MTYKTTKAILDTQDNDFFTTQGQFFHVKA